MYDQFHNMIEAPLLPSFQNFPSIISLVQTDPLLLNYFHRHSNESEFSDFAKKLMLDGIRYRTSQILSQEETLKNLNTVVNENTLKNELPKKENFEKVQERKYFSSKHKKNSITPKITQMIPAYSPPHHIYGKPKIRTDEKCGCPYHSEQEEEKIRLSYKSTSNISQENQKKTYQSAENIEISTKQKGYKKPKQRRVTSESENDTIYVNKIVKISTRKPGKIKIIQTPTHKNEQRKKNKLKKRKIQKNPEKQFQTNVDIDKANSSFQRRIQRQEEKIRQLQGKMKAKNEKIRIISEDVLSLSQNSHEFSSVEENIIIQHRQSRNIEQDCSCSQTFLDGEIPQNQESFSQYSEY